MKDISKKEIIINIIWIILGVVMILIMIEAYKRVV